MTQLGTLLPTVQVRVMHCTHPPAKDWVWSLADKQILCMPGQHICWSLAWLIIPTIQYL